MSLAAETFPPTTIAGHPFLRGEKAGGLLNLRIALLGGPLPTLARALAKLEGVRVTGGPERGYLIHCLGFKMVLSSATDGTADFAHAMVSRAPQTALAAISDLGSLLELLMSEPLAPEKKSEAASDEKRRAGAKGGSSSLRRTAMKPGKPLARKTPLRRKTPLGRGRFGSS